jgi:hypothetical protein
MMTLSIFTLNDITLSITIKNATLSILTLHTGTPCLVMLFILSVVMMSSVALRNPYASGLIIPKGLGCPGPNVKTFCGRNLRIFVIS